MKKLDWILVIVLAFVTAIAILSQLGCCTLGETRCKGNTVQSCDSHGIWYNVQDCSEIDAEFQCCWADEIDNCSCLPEEECP